MSGYPDYRSRPSYRYPDYPELRYRSSSHPRSSTYPRPSNYASYTSPRKRSSSRDTYSTYRNRRNESYGWGTGDYGHRPKRSGAYSSRYPSDYYNPGYSQPAPAPVRRVAWEDLSTSALNYRDSSRSRSLPHFGAYSEGYGYGGSLPRHHRPHSSLAEYRGGVADPTSRRSHSSLGEYRQPQSSRYRDHGGVDYGNGIDYGDNYPSHGGGGGGYGGGGGGYHGGGGLGGGYGLSSRSNPEIAHRKYYEQDVLDYERYWDGRY